MRKKVIPLFCIFFLLLLNTACSSIKSNEHTHKPKAGQEQTSTFPPSTSHQSPKEPEKPKTEMEHDQASNPTEQMKESNQNNKIEESTNTLHFVVDPKTYRISAVNAEEKDTNQKYVLLTFDDTPTAKSTYQILDTLDRYNAKALFFVNGHYAEANLDLLKEIKARGHLIGNHTWWHIYIRKESPEKVKEEIVRLNDFLEKELGERPKYFRPPFGQNSEVSLEIIREEGMQTMNWSNGSLDWELKTPEQIAEQVLSNISNGDNILFHDKQTTADALDEILRRLQDQGYQFVLPTEVILP